MTTNPVRGQNFKHFYYPDERENTIQLEFDNLLSDETAYALQHIEDAIDTMFTRFYGKRNFVITIECHVEGEND